MNTATHTVEVPFPQAFATPLAESHLFPCAPRYSHVTNEIDDLSVRRELRPCQTQQRFYAVYPKRSLVQHASAFTQANDLAWNPQTLFRCQGAETSVPASSSVSLNNNQLSINQ